MTSNELIKRYEELIGAKDFGLVPNKQALHMQWMLNTMRSMPTVTLEERDKFSRWLGFVQGAMWGAGWITVDELREQTRGLVYG